MRVIVSGRDGRRESKVLIIAFYGAVQGVEVFFMISLTNQRYLQVRIADRLEPAPIALETVRPCAVFERQRHAQRINDINIVAALVFHLRRTISSDTYRRSQRRAVISRIYSTERSRTTIADRINRESRLPFTSCGSQTIDMRLFFMTQIRQTVIQQHRVLTIGLITRLDRLRRSDIISERNLVQTRIVAVVKQIVFRDQIRP